MKYFQVEAGIVPKQQGDLHTRHAKVSIFNVGKSTHKNLFLILLHRQSTDADYEADTKDCELFPTINKT